MKLPTSLTLSRQDKEYTTNLILYRGTQALRPRPLLSIPDWANTYRYLGKGTSSVSSKGPVLYSTSLAPHQVEPQLAPTDPTVQMTVYNMASQVGGKTEMIQNVIGYFMHWRPTNIIVMYPTIDSAEKFSKKKLAPTIDATPVLREIISPTRSRSSGNTMLAKDFLGGSIFIVGANSPPSLRGASGEVLIADEVDAYEGEAGEEGDPLELLWMRGESYPDAVKIVASTPTIDGQSRILSLMDISDFRKWFVPCPKCNEFQVLQWDHVRWPDNEPESAWYECDRCNKQLTDDDRRWMYYHGVWRATKPFTGVRGFFFPGINKPWRAQKGFKNSLHQMAVDYLRKDKKETTRKVWINTFQCEGWKLKTEEVEAGPIISRCELYGPVLPAEVLLLVCGADVQQDRIEAEIVGAGIGEETWGIRYETFLGDTDKDEVWKAFDEFLLRKYEHPSGQKLGIAATGVDMSFRPRQVLKFTKPRIYRRIYAVAGCKTPWAPLVSRPRKSTIREAIKFDIGGDVAKETIYARLKLETKGPRYCHFPIGAGYDEEYFHQLTAERLVHHFEDGLLVKREWKKQRDRNEALDIRVYCLGLLDVLNPNWEILAKNLAVTPVSSSSNNPNDGDKPEQEASKPVPKANPRRFTPGFVRRNWKQW